MINLDDDQQLKLIDKSNMLGSIEALADQCEQAWNDVGKISLPEDYLKVKNLVVAGMGGSALGTHIFYSLYQDELKIPLQLINDYSLPASVNSDSLVLLSTYSGTTEEVLSCADIAKTRKAKVLGITTGGKLAEFLIENNYPGYVFNQKFNPCNQPRLGLGYSILGQIALFNKCKLINISDKEIKEMIVYIKTEGSKIKESAKLAVSSIKDRIPVIFASGFLSGNAHAMANQINENSKNFSTYFILSEMNHHLLEGFTHPDGVKNLLALFLNSDFYSDKTKQRINISKDILSKYKIEILEFKPEGDSRLKQVFSTILFGSYVSFYLSMLYDQDPSPIPWVDYFKEQLNKSQ